MFNSPMWWLLVGCTSTLLLLILMQSNRRRGLTPWNIFCWLLLSIILGSGQRLLKAGTPLDSFMSVMEQTILQITSAACLIAFVQGYMKQRKTSQGISAQFVLGNGTLDFTRFT